MIFSISEGKDASGSTARMYFQYLRRLKRYSQSNSADAVPRLSVEFEMEAPHENHDRLVLHAVALEREGITSFLRGEFCQHSDLSWSRSTRGPGLVNAGG